MVDLSSWYVYIEHYSEIFDVNPLFMHLISVLFAIAYLVFNFYLVIHMAVSMGNKVLASVPLVQKYVLPYESDLGLNSYAR